ncbi:MAG: MCE family protein [Deltaproteobacteria bacterium]|nr:MAG: MCE family protein [Deltaproteobacteria bacterium]
MKDERRNYVVVGGFVLAMVVGLVASIAALSGHTGPTDVYAVRYTNVMGLATGTPVYYEGYPVGVIDAITRIPDAAHPHFRVDVRVERGWHIPADSTAEITASGLLSAVVIDIHGGSSPTALEPGSEIASVESANVFSAIASVAAQLGDLSENSLQPLLESLGEGVPEIVENLEGFAIALNETVGRIREVVTPANTARLERILLNLEVTSERVASVTDGLDETRTQLDEVVGTVNRLLEENEGELGHTVVDLHDSLEAVAARIDAISHNLEVTSRNMNEFSSQIRSNPGVLLRGRELPEDVTVGD